MTVTDPAHVQAAAVLRRTYQGRDPVPAEDPALGMVRDLATTTAPSASTPVACHERQDQRFDVGR
jgi:hypothetical protein